MGVVNVLVSLVIGILGTLISVHICKKQLATQTITTRRIEWLRELSKNITAFLYCLKLMAENNNNKDFVEEFYKSKYYLLTQINPTEEEKDAQKLLDIIKKQELNTNNSGIDNVISQITDLSISMGKAEWEKIKIEAGMPNKQKNSCKE